MADTTAAMEAAIANAVAVADKAEEEEIEARALAERLEAEDAEAVADEANLAEMDREDARLAGAVEDDPGSGVRHTSHVGGPSRDGVCPMRSIDEQITDEIVLLNRLPNAIERQATDALQKAEQSRKWAREHEAELITRANRLATFMGMQIEPNDEAELRTLLQPIKVPEGVFSGFEVLATGSVVQSGFETRQQPARQVHGTQAHSMQAPTTKRKQKDILERPQYGAVSQTGFEQRQQPDPKRRRLGLFEGGTQSLFQHSQPAPLFGPRQGDTSVGRRPQYGDPHQNNFEHAQPAHGLNLRPEDIFEPQYGRLSASGFETARRNVGLGQDDILQGGFPDYAPQIGSEFASARQPGGSRTNAEIIFEGGMPDYGPRFQTELDAARLASSFGLGRPNPAGGGRSNLNMMTSPHQPQVAPNKPTYLQGTSGAPQQVESVADAKKDDEKAKKDNEKAKKDDEAAKKKHIIDKCPVVVRQGNGFVELRCDKCGCNSSAAGKFWAGIRGVQCHFKVAHKESPNPTAILARCSARSLSVEEAARIQSGELVIEKLRCKVKDTTQNEDADQAEGADQTEVDAQTEGNVQTGSIVQTEGNVPTRGNDQTGGIVQKKRNVQTEGNVEKESKTQKKGNVEKETNTQTYGNAQSEGRAQREGDDKSKGSVQRKQSAQKESGTHKKSNTPRKYGSQPEVFKTRWFGSYQGD